MKKKIFIMSILGFVLLLPLMGSVGVNARNESFGWVVESEYSRGTTLNIPEVKANIGGKDYSASVSMVFPDGTARKGNSYELTQMGAYSVEARVIIGSQVYSESKNFTVYADMFETADGDSARLAAHPISSIADINGRLVKISQGNELNITQAVDLSAATPSEPIMKFYVVPQVKGEYDFTTIRIRFTDKADSSKYVTLEGIYHHQTTTPRNSMVYWKAGSEAQALTGYESYLDRVHIANSYGAPGLNSFAATPHPDDTNLRTDSISVYMDYAQKRIYAGRSTNFVIDLDDPKYFSDLWGGFDTGECYISVSMDGYQYKKEYASLLITDIMGIDLTQERFYDDIAPQVTIEYDGFAPDQLPVAVVGNPYPIFAATGTDSITSASVGVRVYGDYYSSSKYELSVQNGAFVPTIPGNYTVVYTARDWAGLTTDVKLTVKAVAEYAPLELILNNPVVAGKNGRLIQLADITVNNAVGRYTASVKVVNNGREMAVTDNSFRPDIEGTYTVSITANDYIRRSAVQSYDITVAKADSAVFIELPSLPKYLIAGEKNNLPVAKAYDYSDQNNVKPVAAQIKVIEGTDGRVLDGTDYTPARGLTGVQVCWVAGATQTEPVTIPVVSVTDATANRKIMAQNYFVTHNATSVADAATSSVLITATADNAWAEFVNPLIADGFSIGFAIDSVYSNFGSLVITLTDAEDDNAVLKIAFNPKTGTAIVNDGRSYSWANTQSKYYISYSAGQKTLSDSQNSLSVLNADGSVFGGFGSGKVYVKAELKGVTGNAGLRVTEICSQLISDKSFDLVKPRISILGETGGSYTKGSTVTLHKAVAGDVYSPYTDFRFSVIDPEGGYVKDINGKLLQNADPGLSYQILLEKYGSYIVTFYAEDWADNIERNITYALRVLDEDAPVITVKSQPPQKVAVGSELTVPDATATDELDGDIATVYKYLQTPDGQLRKLKTNKITFTVKGQYVLRYYAYDSAGNYALREFSIAAE